MKILRDRALFTESSSLRYRSIVELQKFGSSAIPIIEDIIDSIVGNSRESFQVFCKNIIKDIQSDEFDKAAKQ
jgi:hypothetical protein